MKILFCSSEVVPFAKTGGLADVSGALPVALERLGCQVKVTLPKYRCVADKNVMSIMGKNIEVYLVENDDYFDRPGLYGDDRGDYSDNLERFSFFCNQVLSLLKRKKFRPQIIHCNDWQTALIPVYLESRFSDDSFFKQVKTIFTIHNLSYQGIFPKDKFIHTGLDWRFFNMHALEFYGKVNLLKGGLVFSRLITTVSPTYAKEIQGREFGCGLDGLLRERRKDLYGIINGLDYNIWNPVCDDKIFQKYGKEDLENKYKNKKKLQGELGFLCDRNIPLMGLVGRLVEQKGVELIISAIDKMATFKLQFVLLGTGDAKYQRLLENIKRKGYKNISINLRFDPILAHKIYAGCDMFLMPSNFEPCGLGQLICFKYGTIPVVRKTGGLADTVFDYKTEKEDSNGFVFEKYSSDAMLKAINRAMELYKNKEKWQRLTRKVMDYDFSWEHSAKEYIKLYQRVFNE